MPGKLSAADEKMWDRAKRAVSKSRGKRFGEFGDRDWGLVTHIFKKIKGEQVEAKKKKKKRKQCSMCVGYGCHLCNYHGWVFAPLYGDGKGHSGATTPPNNVTQTAPTPSPSGPAYPGAGGINAPGVPAGPNTGMGPISASKDPSGKPRLSEDLDYMMNVLSAQPDEGMMDEPIVKPVVVPVSAPAEAPQPEKPKAEADIPEPEVPSAPKLDSALAAIIHKGFTKAADNMAALNQVTQQERIILSSCISDALKAFGAALAEKAPWAKDRELSVDVVKMCLEGKK